MTEQTGEKGRRKSSGRSRRSPARMLDEAIDLLLELIQDGRQRLDEAGSTTEWVRLAGALGLAETRLAQMLGTQARMGAEKSDFEQALLNAIREWHARSSPVVASGRTVAELEAEVSQDGPAAQVQGGAE